MDINNFSSIFELLCGYNFVNAVNESDAERSVLKFLDFTDPIKTKIEGAREKLNYKIAKLKEIRDTSNDSDDDLDNAVMQRVSIKRLAKHTKDHSKKAGNLYLIAGIFAFFVLLFSGICDEQDKMRKYNSFAILIIGTVIIFFIFLKADFKSSDTPAGKREKLVLISITALITILCILQQFNICCPVGERSDRLYWIFILSGVLLLGLLFFRGFILGRKTYKAFLIVLFMVVFMVFNTTLMFESFYGKNAVAWLTLTIIVMILVLLVPFLYDIGYSIRYHNQLKTALDAVEKISFKEEIDTSPKSDVIFKNRI